MSELTLPVHPDTLHDELVSIQKIIGKWENKVNKEGIPGVDLPTGEAEVKLDAFLRELSGELLLVSGKCNSLAMILAER